MTSEHRLPVRRATIDVGTNSVKLLVADVCDNTVSPIVECACQTRLGAEFYPAGRLTAKAISRTADAVADFASKARDLGATRIRVVATSAAREAHNAADLISAIQNLSGLETEILSGDLEARLAFAGVASDARLAGKTLLLVEVGGGSTQIILGRHPTTLCQSSLPVGAVRLLEHVSRANPPTTADRMRCQDAVRSVFDGVAARELRTACASITKRPEAVASGGTATVLGAMQRGLAGFDREQIESVVFAGNDLRGWLDRLWSMPLSERRRIPGLPPERADVILTGTTILAGAMECFSLDALRISTRGLRFGALAD